jgi:hypothetical protein
MNNHFSLRHCLFFSIVLAGLLFSSVVYADEHEPSEEPIDPPDTRSCPIGCEMGSDGWGYCDEDEVPVDEPCPPSECGGPGDPDCPHCIKCEREGAIWGGSNCVPADPVNDPSGCMYDSEPLCEAERASGGDCADEECYLCVHQFSTVTDGILTNTDDGRRDKGDYVCNSSATDADTCDEIETKDNETYCGTVNVDDDDEMEPECYASPMTQYSCQNECDCKEFDESCGYVTDGTNEAFQQCCDQMDVSGGSMGSMTGAECGLNTTDDDAEPGAPSDVGVRLRCLILELIEIPNPDTPPPDIVTLPPLWMDWRGVHSKESGTCKSTCGDLAAFWAAEHDCDFPGGPFSTDPPDDTACCKASLNWWLSECTCTGGEVTADDVEGGDGGGGDDESCGDTYPDCNGDCPAGETCTGGGGDTCSCVSFSVLQKTEEENILVGSLVDIDSLDIKNNWEKVNDNCACQTVENDCAPTNKIEEQCFTYICTHESKCYRRLKEQIPQGICEEYILNRDTDNGHNSPHNLFRPLDVISSIAEAFFGFIKGLFWWR